MLFSSRIHISRGRYVEMQMICTELVTCPLSIHIKIITKIQNLGFVPPCEEGGPHENDVSNLLRPYLWLPLSE